MTEKLIVPGGILTSQGAQDYAGAVPSITAVLFFKDAHEPDIRDAVRKCFDEYRRYAEPHLTWLWREESPDGQDKLRYEDAKPIATMMARLRPNDALSFAYVSGQREYDAGEWEFQVFGRRAWEAKLPRAGLSVLRFTFPPGFVDEHPTTIQELFVRFAGWLRAVHGYAGFGLVRSLVRDIENEPFEAMVSERFYGLDVGGPVEASRGAATGIKTVSWLTAIGAEFRPFLVAICSSVEFRGRPARRSPL